MTSQSYHPCEGCGAQVPGSEELCAPCSGQSVQSYGHAMRALRAEARKIRESTRVLGFLEEVAILNASAGKLDEVADFIRDAVFMDAADLDPEPVRPASPITCSKATRAMDRAASLLLWACLALLVGAGACARVGGLTPAVTLLVVLALMAFGSAIVLTVAAPPSVSAEDEEVAS